MLTNLLLLIVFPIIKKKYFHGNKIDLNLFVAVSSVGFFLFFYLSLFLIQILRSNFFQFLVKKRCTQLLFFSPRFKQNASRHFASTPPQLPPPLIYITPRSYRVSNKPCPISSYDLYRARNKGFSVTVLLIRRRRKPRWKP